MCVVYSALRDTVVESQSFKTFVSLHFLDGPLFVSHIFLEMLYILCALVLGTGLVCF